MFIRTASQTDKDRKTKNINSHTFYLLICYSDLLHNWNAK